MGKFVIKTGSDGQFYFSLRAENGAKILASEGYKKKDSCKNGIAAVQKNAIDDSKFEKKKSANGKYYFNLKAGNNEIIGTSEMYESSDSCNNGINSVKLNAPDAIIIEE